jgi:phosphohistidine phosphatase
MPGPYELYVIRHAVAEERGESWPDDAKRPLSEDGASRMRKAARGLDRLGVTVDVVVTSPLVRTKQTAEIVAAALNPKPPVVTAESLAPDGTYQEIITDLEKQAKRTRIAIVGHEPGIGEFAARLIGSRHSIPFKKGAICRIDVDALPPSGPGDLRWMLTTRILRSIRK